ncbi:hypothetical protein RHSIM_Rhsim01G0153900 [Rhododendron simsii]|uniref:Protein FAR1-RELATED SEQUENCE n=1 Tax=Rhododendron simsii TaxID=118357 RepID=A0A834HIQ8_RHOSS|nr:hypothetical protein RHSIM_Rhsim01G0153900 [Rhododendron simsii]
MSIHLHDSFIPHVEDSSNHLHLPSHSSLLSVPLRPSSLAPSHLTSPTLYVGAPLTSKTNDAAPIIRRPGVMATPNKSTNKKGMSYDWESNSESECCFSREDSHSNTFGGNDVEGEGEGSISSIDDSLRLLNDTKIVQMKFVSEEEAGRFYNAYAKAMGFSVRKHKSKPHRGNEGYVKWRSWVCSREGKRNKKHLERTDRKRRHRAETRIGYGAKFRVCCRSNTIGNYDVTEFYSVDEEDRLETLFWADGRSQMDYAAFGDVLVFDTTHRTNAYKKPFVILAGVSNNSMTTIFGCALLSNEVEEMYNWVLATFLDAMDGKRPISMVTDGDLAMRNAIRNIFPHARHQICSWHLERNAAKNVHRPEFVSDFTKLMQMECEVEEFESLWADMVSHYGLQTIAWVVEMYKDRERWAEAYLLGHFFAGMRTT